MKRLIGLILAAAMVLSAVGCSKTPGENTDLMHDIKVSPVENIPVEDSAAQMMDFFLNLSRQSAGEGNMLVSPLSVLAALSMTANGAKGETLTQMEALLGMKTEQLNAWMHSYMESLPDTGESSLKLANSIWFTDDESFTPVEAFLQTNADYYGAGIYQTPFDSTTLIAINNWVSAHTNGMIQNILDEIPADAVMYLVNALAFEALWSAAYEEFQVREDTFTMADGTERTVQLMNSEEAYYLEDDWATGFIKYYKGGDYAFVAMLPNEGITTTEYLHRISGESLYETLANPEEVTVFAAIPKFEMEYSVEMSEVLKSLGMVDAFDADAADFSNLGASAVGNIHISRVLHKTTITVAEQGTKAGAATVVEMRANGALELGAYKEVTLNCPFVYMLVDCENHLPFFIGTMEDPAQTENKIVEIVLEPEEVLNRPPELTLHCAERTATVQPSSYHWDYSVSECDCAGVIACGAHPLEFKDYVTLQPESDRITLSFTAPAESWSVTCWSEAYHGKTDAETMDVTLTEDGFVLNAGDCIYLVTAHWDTPLYNGTAEYAFRIEN